MVPFLEVTKKGERVMYVALDESPNEVRQNMRSFGWDIGRVLVFDATPDILSYDKTPVRDVSTERKVEYFADISESIRKTSERSPVDVSINTLQEMLKQEMKVSKYTRVVIDSMTSLRFFYIKTSEENASLVSLPSSAGGPGNHLSATVQLPEIAQVNIEAHMARGEIRLHKWFDGRGLMRGLTIEKYRGSSHDHRLRPMKITSDGVIVKSMPMEKSVTDSEGLIDGDNAKKDELEHIPPPPPEEPLPPPPESHNMQPPSKADLADKPRRKKSARAASDSSTIFFALSSPCACAARASRARPSAQATQGTPARVALSQAARASARS